MASKYVAFYNSILFPFDDVKQFATDVMGYRLVRINYGGWDVFINGKAVAHYSEEFTEEQVERDYFNTFFSKNTYKNLHFYQLI